MTIGEILKHKDIDTYRRLMNMFRIKKPKKKEKVEVGCSIEELMKTDSYSREGRRVKQRSWG